MSRQGRSSSIAVVRSNSVVVNIVVFGVVLAFFFVATANSLRFSNDIVKGGRGFLHKRDAVEDIHAAMVKKVFHYDEEQVKLLVTIAKHGGGTPSDEAKQVLAKLFNFTVQAEDSYRMECWLYLETLDLTTPLTEEEEELIMDLIVRPITRPIYNAQFSEGVAAEKANLVTQQYGYTGNGILVGVISDSLNLDGKMQQKINDGELPSRAGAIRILSEGTACDPSFNGGTGCRDEGRMLMEIIYDTAPNANYLFYSAVGGQLTHAQAIASLAANGAQIIVDDVIYLSEPWYQAGSVYNAVTQASQSSIYVISAGNFGDQSVQQQFKFSKKTIDYTKGDVEVTMPTHLFAKGKDYIEFVIPASITITIALQWAEPFPYNGGAGAITDLDLLITTVSDISKVTALLQGTENSVGDAPYEVAAIQASAEVTIRIAVVKASGTASPLFKVLIAPAQPKILSAFKKLKSYQPKGTYGRSTIVAQANNPLAVTVGAADARTKTLQGFSSVGGSMVYSTVSATALSGPTGVAKPNILGPDGVATSEFRFYGTSAASASVGGVIALLKEGSPNLTAAQAISALQRTALDIKPKGFDFSTGYGFIDAKAAADSLASS